MSRATQDTTRRKDRYVYGAITRYGRTFQTAPLESSLPSRGPTTPTLPKQRWFGLFPVRSPLLGESFLFSLPGGTKMFQFPPFAYLKGIHELHSCGLPHSEITGSMAICAYPMLIAAYHVLLRL